MVLLLLGTAIQGARSQGACIPPPSGVVGWWPGDGNANDIVGPNDGTVVNGTTFGQGNVGQAFVFDGVNDLVRVPGFDSELNGLSSATFEFWVKMHAYPSAGGCNTGSCDVVLMNKTDFRFGLAIHSSLAVEVSRGNGSYWISATLSDGTLTGLNQWNHVAVVLDGTTIRPSLISSMKARTHTPFLSGLIRDKKPMDREGSEPQEAKQESPAVLIFVSNGKGSGAPQTSIMPGKCSCM